MATPSSPGTMKILILGASGQIGKILNEALRKNHEVTGTSRRSFAGLLQFDPFTDNWKTLRKPNVIINCIGQIEPSRRFSFSRIHLELAKRIIENRRAVGNPRIIQISALGASRNHPVEFLRTKGEADAYLRKFPDVVVVRPSIVCTHRTMMVKKMLMLFKLSQWMKGRVIVPEGFAERQIQPVMPDDLVALIERLCSALKIPKSLDVPGPAPLRFHEIINLMFAVRRKHFKLVTVPRRLTDILVKYGVSIILPRLITAQQYQLLFHDNVADPADAQNYLGSPMRQTEEFWMREFHDHATY